MTFKQQPRTPNESLRISKRPESSEQLFGSLRDSGAHDLSTFFKVAFIKFLKNQNRFTAEEYLLGKIDSETSGVLENMVSYLRDDTEAMDCMDRNPEKFHKVYMDAALSLFGVADVLTKLATDYQEYINASNQQYEKNLPTPKGY